MRKTGKEVRKSRKKKSGGRSGKKEWRKREKREGKEALYGEGWTERTRKKEVDGSK